MGADFDEHLALRALQPLRDCFLHARVQPIREVFCVLGSPQLRDVGQPGTERRRDLFAALETRLIELDHAAEVGPRPPSSGKDEKQEQILDDDGDDVDDGDDIASDSRFRPQESQRAPAAPSTIATRDQLASPFVAPATTSSLALAPASTSSPLHRTSSRLSQSQLPARSSGASDWRGAGVTEQEWWLCSVLAKLPRIDPAIKASLSDAGRLLLRELRSASRASLSSAALAPAPLVQPSAPSSSSAATTGSRARASSAAGRGQAVVDTLAAALPTIPAVLHRSSAAPPVPPGRPSANSTVRLHWQPRAEDDSDGYESDPEHQAVPPLFPAADAAALSQALLRLGVPDALAHDDMYRQACEFIGQRAGANFHSYWTAHFSSIRDLRTFHEGQVLALLLDHVSDLEYVREITARRWFVLHSVASGGRWSTSEAILPLSAAPGFTARQQTAMHKYGRTNDSAPQQTSAPAPSRSRPRGSWTNTGRTRNAAAGEAQDPQSARPRNSSGWRRGSGNATAGGRRQRSGSRGAGSRPRGSVSGTEEQ
jgi:hypothetical protein